MSHNESHVLVEHPNEAKYMYKYKLKLLNPTSTRSLDWGIEVLKYFLLHHRDIDLAVVNASDIISAQLRTPADRAHGWAGGDYGAESHPCEQIVESRGYNFISSVSRGIGLYL